MMWIAVVWFCVCALANGLDVQNVPEDMIGDRQDADHDAESAVLGDSPSSLNEQYGRPAVIPAKPMDTSIEEASERSKVPTTEGRLNPAFHFDAKAVMQEKVVGGGPITAGEAPFYVQIITKTGQGEWVNNGCGGSLISPRHVLTAAHCVDDIQNTIGRGNKGVYVNAYKPFDSIPGNNGGEPIHFSVMESVILHPDFDVVTLDHDVAVVTLIDPVPDTSIFTPIYLAENSPSDKDTVVVYGLGRLSEFSATKPDFVQKADLEYMSRNTCNIFYSNRLADSMFCAGFLYGGVDACNGDSGGPLIYETTEGVKEQVGVVSWGDGCALALKPGVYSNTVDQRTWIKSQVCPNLSTAEGIATPICVDDIASATPSAEPSAKPSAKPSSRPSGTPSIGPSASPSVSPSASPSARPSTSPSASSISDSPQPSTSSVSFSSQSANSAGERREHTAFFVLAVLWCIYLRVLV